MQSVRKLAHWLAAPVVLGASLSITGAGEIQQVCNCGRGARGGIVSAPVTASPYVSAPVFDDGLSGTIPWEQPMLPPTPIAPIATAAPVSPPPGTLGRTYQLPTKLIPAQKHPRVAMLDIRTTAAEVVVSDTKEFRDEDDVKGFQDEDDPSLWHFETKPLISGVPHVYKIEFINGGTTTDVRYVRLIRGRLLELSF